MKHLILTALLVGLSAGSAAAHCSDEIGDAALVEAGYDPDATDVYDIRDLGRFAIPTRFRLTRRVVKRPDGDTSNKPAWTYGLRNAPTKAKALFGFEFLMSAKGEDCSEPFLVLATIAGAPLADGPMFDARRLRKLASGNNPKVTPVTIEPGLLRLDGATNLGRPVLMYAYLADGSALRLVGGTKASPMSSLNGLDAKRGLAVTIHFTHPDPLMWDNVMTEIEALMTAWRVN